MSCLHKACCRQGQASHRNDQAQAAHEAQFKCSRLCKHLSEPTDQAAFTADNAQISDAGVVVLCLRPGLGAQVHPQGVSSANWAWLGKRFMAGKQFRYMYSFRLACLPAENGFMGMGIGAAMTGLRPVVEGMNMGFLLLAFNQISNNCGMLHYTSGGQYRVPIVVRGPGGVGKQLGAEHSQRLESYFQSIPGVQIVAVSTVRNSKALLKAAIRSANPVIFFEHVLLYNLKGDVGGVDEVASLERAEVVRTGSDCVIFTYSRMRWTVMQAVAALTKEVRTKYAMRHRVHGLSHS